MPCGGIYPVRPPEDFSSMPAECFHCSKGSEAGPLDHFCDEWDAYIHGTCVEEFLKTESGQIVLHHNHCVIVADHDGNEKDLNPGGRG